MDLFGFDPGAPADELYDAYSQYRAQIAELPVADAMVEALLALVNRAYDQALAESAEVSAHATSPRALSPRALSQRALSGE